MNLSTGIALGGLAVVLGGIGIRLIMQATRLIDAVEKLDVTIKAAIEDHELRLHPLPHRRHHAG